MPTTLSLCLCSSSVVVVTLNNKYFVCFGMKLALLCLNNKLLHHKYDNETYNETD